MLASQRALFDIPRDVCYLNAAGWSPLPLAVQDAGRRGVARKGRPWLLDTDFANAQHERARKAAAALIGAQPDDVALISSVGYGVATAAKAIDVPRGSRVLVLEDDHCSPVLEWTTRAQTGGFTVEVVRRRADGDWTAAVLAAIARPGAPDLAAVSISSVHWSDGGTVDLARVSSAVAKTGAALLIDATHAVGVMALDVAALKADFVIFPTYKWLLGPYGRAFLYVSKRYQSAIPLEQTGFGRKSVRAEQDTYFADTAYVASARRFDMGERDHFISMEMASAGMELLAGWGTDAVRARLAMLTDTIEAMIRHPDVAIPRKEIRAPHILSVTPLKMPAKDIVSRLAAQNVHVALRLGRIRISPHVYNDEADCERFAAAFRSACGA